MNKKKIKNKLEVLKELEAIDPNFPIKWAICFYEIALNEGLTIQELSEKTGYPLSTLSRIVYGLSGRKRYNKSPFELIKVAMNSSDKRSKILKVSDTGKYIV